MYKIYNKEIKITKNLKGGMSTFEELALRPEDGARNIPGFSKAQISTPNIDIDRLKSVANTFMKENLSND